MRRLLLGPLPGSLRRRAGAAAALRRGRGPPARRTPRGRLIPSRRPAGGPAEPPRGGAPSRTTRRSPTPPPASTSTRRWPRSPARRRRSARPSPPASSATWGASEGSSGPTSGDGGPAPRRLGRRRRDEDPGRHRRRTSTARSGQDIVNHCVDDILVQGARPLFFLDYVATGRMRREVIAEVIGGVAVACRENGCALLGGETAEMPGMYADGDYDLAGTIVGVVDRPKLLDGSRVAEGDVLLGLASSGLHTNGYSLARMLFFERLGLGPHDAVPELGTTVAEALLAVHRSYLAPAPAARRRRAPLGDVAHHRRRVPRQPPARPPRGPPGRRGAGGLGVAGALPVHPREGEACPRTRCSGSSTAASGWSSSSPRPNVAEVTRRLAAVGREGPPRRPGRERPARRPVRVKAVERRLLGRAGPLVPAPRAARGPPLRAAARTSRRSRTPASGASVPARDRPRPLRPGGRRGSRKGARAGPAGARSRSAAPARRVRRTRSGSRPRIEESGADLVCLAGFMRVLSPGLRRPFRAADRERPPLAPPGLPGPGRAETGARARREGRGGHGPPRGRGDRHRADRGPGGGPGPPGRRRGAPLAARILAAEHRLYPATVARLLAGGWTVAGRRLTLPRLRRPAPARRANPLASQRNPTLVGLRPLLSLPYPPSRKSGRESAAVEPLVPERDKGPLSLFARISVLRRGCRRPGRQVALTWPSPPRWGGQADGPGAFFSAFLEIYA